MKSILSCLFFLIAGSAVNAEELYLRQTVLDSVPLPTTVNRSYRLLVPAAPKDKPDQKFPLVVYLHGGGSRGEDGVKPTGEPLPKLLATPEMRGNCPCVVLVPQCREGD